MHIALRYALLPRYYKRRSSVLKRLRVGLPVALRVAPCQVESFVAVLRRLVDADPQRSLRVIDFGCGTGALMLPLACMFPDCSFTGKQGVKPKLALVCCGSLAGNP